MWFLFSSVVWLSCLCFFFSSRRRHTRYWRDWSSDVCSFFSSRRRHTRYWRDWSSDVCSSDLLSIEFQKTGSLVYLTNKALVGNSFPGPAPVPVLYAQFEADTQKIQKDLVFGQPDFDLRLEGNKQAFFADFESRPQFGVAFPTTLTAAQFADALIANTGVAFTATQRTAIISKFGSESSSTANNDRARVSALRLVAENSTFAAAEFNRTFVTMEYFGYLRRDPDASGFNFWLNKLNTFNGNFVDAEMVKSFISSSEYRRRFGAN